MTIYTSYVLRQALQLNLKLKSKSPRGYLIYKVSNSISQKEFSMKFEKFYGSWFLKWTLEKLLKLPEAFAAFEASPVFPCTPSCKPVLFSHLWLSTHNAGATSRTMQFSTDSSDSSQILALPRCFVLHLVSQRSQRRDLLVRELSSVRKTAPKTERWSFTRICKKCRIQNVELFFFLL